jgi:hypothetical protein
MLRALVLFAEFHEKALSMPLDGKMRNAENLQEVSDFLSRISSRATVEFGPMTVG